tara:strand:+ start:365 stop:760 length:396 start_codon:yes stop_codon:yes gene_type:complete
MMNRVFISGHLGQKPEARKAKSGLSIANFSVATNQRVKKGDEWVDATDWHRIVVFGKSAEHCEQYLDKGSKVIVEGRIQNRSFEDKEGNKRWVTEILADRVEFVSRPMNGAGEQQPKQPTNENRMDEEIPF